MPLMILLLIPIFMPPMILLLMIPLICISRCIADEVLHLANFKTLRRMAACQFMPSAFKSPPGGKHIDKLTLKFGNWNVRTLNDTLSDLSPLGRADELIGELQRYGIDICCLSEVKWPGQGSVQVAEWEVAFSGSSQKRHGVGIAMSPSLKQCLCHVDSISDRLMIAVFQMGKIKLHVISVYAPTDDKEDIEKEVFYDSLQLCFAQVPVRDKVIIAGDFNAQLGGQARSTWLGILGKFCLGERVTDNGTRLLSFCAANELVVRNTFFEQKTIHLATWVGLSGHLQNQIDHVLVRRGDAKHVQRPGCSGGQNFKVITT